MFEQDVFRYLETIEIGDPIDSVDDEEDCGQFLKSVRKYEDRYAGLERTKTLIGIKFWISLWKNANRLKDQYDQGFKEQLENIIQLATPEVITYLIYYAAHLPIITPDKLYATLRVVFNALASSKKGH
ncbi:unnamed protein product [Dracunculus medinensis]|uniref:Uncharacterized protein n=1 Tax=Dracunculus medinensis TaxID=318479 RepID=A0A0N4U0Q6_DRAME|nr:unnamed protein product [Dracunculus medinensis]